MTLFKIAQRTQAKLRLAIDGPSGSGKTYSALLVAKGLAGGDLAKVALIDTERGSGSLYSDLGSYAVLDFGPPYTVARFVKAHDAAVAEGYEVIVIDSLTHFWSGEGGILDAVDKIAATSPSGNSFAAWKKGTPLQKQFMDTMLASPAHIVATVRSKVEWVIEENEKGKKAPRKVGMAPDQRKDLEYEFTLVLSLSREHIAAASKDRTSLFDDRLEIPSEKMGEELAAWLGSAAPESPTPPTAAQAARADEQREQAAAAEKPAAQAPSATPAPSGNGTITPAEVEQIRVLIAAKGRTDAGVLAILARKGVGDGENLASIPSAQLVNILTVLDNLADPEPPEPVSTAAPVDPVSADDFAEPAQEPTGETITPAAATEASEPVAAPQEPPVAQGTAEDEEIPPGMDAAAAKAHFAEQNMAEEGKAKAKRKPTVTAPQLTRLGAQCAELEALGVGRDEWRLYLSEKENVSSRKELSKTGATRAIDYLQRWLTDIKCGVAAPGERAVA